jgi:genome maintenance exonuclease 1
MLFEHHNHGIDLPPITRKTTEQGRRYFTPTGEAYPSVTTVLGILGKASLMAWRKRVGEEEANRISSQAARRGTAVHKLCENYLDNKEDYKEGVQPANLFMFNTMKPLLDNKINNIWFQEAFLYSDELQTAGQVDCIAEYDGKLSVIDFKTSRRLKSVDQIQNYFMQVSFYAKAFEERTGQKIEQGVVLIGVDDAEPQEFFINPDDYIEHFKAVRETYANLYEKEKVHNN